MRPIFMKTFFCISFSFLFIKSLSALPVYWVGNGDGINWSDPENWNMGVIPGFTSDVTIPPNSGQIYYDMQNQYIASLSISDGNEFRILAGKTLNLLENEPVDYYFEDPDRYLISNRGSLQNDGQLILFNARGGGIYNDSNIENFGTVRITNHRGRSIWNLGSFNNIENGVLELYSHGSEYINTGSRFYNNNEIFLFESGPETDGIFIDGFFTNDIQGVIHLDLLQDGILIDGQMRNMGNIDCSKQHNAIHLLEFANFINDSTGQLNINGCQSNFGISMRSHSFFTNNGNIEIINAESERGITIDQLAIFINNESISIECDNFCTAINNQGIFENNKLLTISGANYGISNNSYFTNKDEAIIEISDCTNMGIYNFIGGEFENEAATINLSNLGECKDIYNQGRFKNRTCGDISTNRIIQNNYDGIFTNYGWLSSLVPGPDHLYFSNEIMNYGIVVDPYNRFDDALDNLQTRIVGLEITGIGSPLTQVFDVYDTSMTDIDNAFYTFPEMEFAGSYFYKNNIYYPNSSVYKTNELSFNTTIGDCSKLVHIPVDYRSFKSVEINRPDQNAEEVSINIFPNPTTDGIQVNLTHELKGDGQLELMNTQGKILRTDKSLLLSESFIKKI